MKLNFKLIYWIALLIISFSSSALYVIAVAESPKLYDESVIVTDKNVIFINSDNANNPSINNKDENNNVDRTSCALNSDCNNINIELNSDSSIDSKIDDKFIVSNENQHNPESNEIKDATHAKVASSGETLPDIPAKPTVVIAVTEKSSDLQIEPVEDADIKILIPTKNDTENDSDVGGDINIKNDFPIIPAVSAGTTNGKSPQSEGFEIESQSEKINDSGGVEAQPADIEASGILLNIPSNLDTTENADVTPDVNLTAEEKSIPVFSEWAQKQMEEAEKKLEQEVVNSSSQKKNATNGAKPPVLKLRTKNYASPDCGAKIIASNTDAQNTGALLTSSKDEYMLSPCTNRIWFVVELCEAIQAEKIDLANFELFSSSPKNFTVAVSNRFPTRDWSNVGRFIAADQRNIQGFDLHPHLFGKFVRVDIHSHYNSEHFCPVSLFRVYGTSEFEAFETENRASDDIDDYDDDINFDQGIIKNENNLFKSASDAVLSIVKKAAEVLVKTNSNKTESDRDIVKKDLLRCETIISDNAFTCEKCSGSFVSSVNYLLSCKNLQLVNFLNIELLRNHLITSKICTRRFNIDTLNLEKIQLSKLSSTNCPVKDEKQSYILSLMPYEYLASFCHLLVHNNFKGHSPGYKTSSQNTDEEKEAALNLTIDNKLMDGNFETLANERKESDRIPTLNIIDGSTKFNENVGNDAASKEEKSNETNDSNVLSSEKEKQFKESEIHFVQKEEQKPNTKFEEALEDVNIFNLEHIAQTESNDVQTPTVDDSSTNLNTNIEDPTMAEITTTSTPSIKMADKTETETIKMKEVEEPSSWESIDNLLTEQASAEVASNSDSNGISNGQTNQQRLSNGPQSESVFIRLSNRIKALERNMSLSGQYLEELSRRYKKQVEELQNSFAKTLLAIDEQNRRGDEREQFLLEENHRLRKDLSELSLQMQAWIVLIVCIGAVVILQIIISWFLVRSIRRRQKRIFENLDNNIKNKSENKRQVSRRKSVEEVSGQQSPLKKLRRPSEEAMHINGSYKDLLILGEDENEEEICNAEELAESRDEFCLLKNPRQRQRKSSVFYSKDDNLPVAKRNSKLWLFRQESTPGNYANNTIGISPNPINDQDQSILDEDFANFLPGSDLAYNEFMPEGPSGAQIITNNGETNKFNKDSNLSQTGSSEKARRRLSSPAFLKSSFSKITSNSSKKSPHEPTSWEWLKGKDSKKQAILTKSSSQNGHNHLNPPQIKHQLNGNSVGTFGNASPNSSISEVINMSSGASGSENSLRISEISISTNDQHRASSVSSSGNDSSLTNSSRSSKKQRSFKKILKKVF